MPGTVGTAEAPLGVGVTLDPPAALVDCPVVRRAQQDEVVEIGRTAVGPVPDVVGVKEPLATAEPAASVAQEQEPVQPGRHVAVGAAEPDDLAVFVVDDRLQASIAGQTAGGL